MSQEKQEEYSQASSFVQNGLDEQTSTSDLDTLRQQKPFCPVGETSQMVNTRFRVHESFIREPKKTII